MVQPTGHRPPPGTLSTTAERGYTLAEILVVLLVLALAVGVALANLRILEQRSRLEAESRELASFLRSVPNQARELHGLVFLQWDAASRQLTVTVDEAGAELLASHRVSDKVAVATALPALLRCDTLSRAYVGQSPSMMTTVQTIDLEHVRNLGPTVSYRLVLSPLWSVVEEKRVE